MTLRPVVAAKVLLIDSSDNCLVLTRSDYGGRPDILDGQPDLPGGVVDPGELASAAAVREVYEETAINISQDNLRLVYADTKPQDGYGVSLTWQLYVYRLALPPPITLSQEHEAYSWHPLTELTKAYEFKPFYQRAIDYIVEHGLLAALN